MVVAGELKRKVVLKQPTESRNTEGGKETTYTSLPQVRAKIERTNLRLMEVAPVLLNTDTVTIRYSDAVKDVNINWLVNYDSKDHVIHQRNYLGLEEKEWIELIVKNG